MHKRTLSKIAKTLNGRAVKKGVGNPLKEFELSNFNKFTQRVMDNAAHPAGNVMEFEVGNFEVTAIHIPSLQKWDVKAVSKMECLAFFVFEDAKKKAATPPSPEKMSQKDIEHYVFDLGYTEWSCYLK